MSFPLSTVTTVLGAAALAREAVQRVSGAIGFDQVLQSASPEEVGKMVGKLVDSIRQRLTGAGIEANQALPIGLQDSGELRVDVNHPQAAQIEALLNGDPALVGAARQLRQLGGPAEVSLDLTKTGAEGNIRGTPGGYANWLAD